VATRGAAPPRPPRRSLRAPMHILAVMRSYAKGFPTIYRKRSFLKFMLDNMSELTYIRINGLL
jgi:hypothetical protein